MRKATLALSILAAVLLAGCSGGGHARQSATATRIAPRAGATKLPIAETVAELGNSRRAEAAVWSVLAHLGIGVYRANGTRVLAGSERKARDFWIYDFEVPLLARMVGETAQPFDAYTRTLALTGVRVPRGELLSTYRRVYAHHPHAYLVRLLSGLGITFAREPRLTPFEAWVLELDTLVPPNRKPRLASAAAGPCDIVGPALSGWGFVNGAASWAEVIGAEAAYRALNAPLLAQGVSVSVTANPGEVHEGHHGLGARMTLEVGVELHATQVPVTVTCGILSGLQLPEGPLAGAVVTIRTPPVFHEHGSVETGQPLTTDASGRTALVFQAREEPSHGKGQFHAQSGVVLAEADIRPALAGHADPILLQLMPPAAPASAAVTVSWHSLKRKYSFSGIRFNWQPRGAYFNDRISGTACAADPSSAVWHVAMTITNNLTGRGHTRRFDIHVEHPGIETSGGPKGFVHLTITSGDHPQLRLLRAGTTLGNQEMTVAVVADGDC